MQKNQPQRLMQLILLVLTSLFIMSCSNTVQGMKTDFRENADAMDSSD